MPYISDDINIKDTMYDRRRKLTAEQKQDIRDIYATGVTSLNKLALEYGVSKKTILLIVNDESKAKSDLYIKQHWAEFKGTKAERAKAIREHRRYKPNYMLKEKLKKWRTRHDNTRNNRRDKRGV